MAYTVEFSDRAERDIDEIVVYIQADSPVHATRWRKRLQDKLLALTTMPESGGFAPENIDARCEVRQLLYGRYRVLYTIHDEVVYLLTIRHGARQSLTGDEIDSIQ